MNSLSTWTRSLIERRLNESYIRMICVLVLAAYLVILSISFGTNVRGRTIFGPFLGADFGAFYIAGRIFNTYPPDRIYDSVLHQQLYQQQFPDAPPDSHLPYANAPFFILPFTLLARLPYSWAYFVWLLFSLALYVAGLALLWGTLKAIPDGFWLTTLLLAVSFMPFLVECLAGGQTSACGVSCVALAITFERRGHPILSGLALSLCSYKPTLLLLILPMLLITGRYATLLAVVAGNGLLVLLSLAVVGWQGCLGYLHTLFYFANASVSTVSGLRPWKYADLNSFFRLLLGERPVLRWMLLASSSLIGLGLLARCWWRAERKSENDQSLVWALTLAWTPVLNIYMGIYDSSLIVLSVLLTTDVLYRRVADRTRLSYGYKTILLLLYVTPWITQAVARLTGIQFYTLTLVLLGCFQIKQFRLQEVSP